MANLFGSKDLPAALAYDTDRSAYSDAQKEAWLDYDEGNFVNYVSAAIQRISTSVASLAGKIQSRLAKPAPAFHAAKLQDELGS